MNLHLETNQLYNPLHVHIEKLATQCMLQYSHLAIVPGLSWEMATLWKHLLHHHVPILCKHLNFCRQRYSQQRFEVSADVSEYSFGIGMYNTIK